MSPFVISYLANKTISLASANITLTKKVAVMTQDIGNQLPPPAEAPQVVATAAPPNLPTVTAATVPDAVTKTTAVTVKPARIQLVHHVTHPRRRVAPIEPPVENFDELLNRNHEHD